MLYIINDTRVSVGTKISKSASQGGTSAYVADFINFLLSQNVRFGLIGNFGIEDAELKHYFPIHPESNFSFLKHLFRFFQKHTFTSEDTLYFQRPDHAATARFTKAKIVIHLHGQQRTSIKNRRGFLERLLYNYLERTGLKRAAKVIATDSITSEIYRKHYPFLNTKLVIIPTGIDTEYFQHTAEDNALISVSHVKTLIYIGRLAYPKRVDQVIRAFEIAGRQTDSLRLIITGEGADSHSLRELVNQSGLQSKVEFTGSINKAEIKQKANQSIGGILLSYHEGSPISVKELLACGKPVICNNAGDVTDYIKTGLTGIIVNADSLQEIAAAMVKLAENPDIYTENCLEMAKKYDAQNLMDTTFREIKSIEDPH